MCSTSFNNEATQSSCNQFFSDSDSEDVYLSHENNVLSQELKNQDLETFLCEWITIHGIPHNAVSSLLKKLKDHTCFKHLPADPRTLLKTPRNTLTRTVPPGTYYHFGLETAITHVVQSLKDNFKNDNIKIAINIDGLPISKSSANQFWPILGSISPYKHVFTIGIYYGLEKCKDVNDFLHDFVSEAKILCRDGIVINDRNIKCEINALICDAPAKSFILYTKGHNGYSSCSKCTIRGEYRKGRMCFPQINAAKRSDQDFYNKVDEVFITYFRCIMEKVSECHGKGNFGSHTILVGTCC